MLDSVKEKQRVRWIDIAKGIGILLVIGGHSTTGGVVMGAIFSFHMPLFFLLSGIHLGQADTITAACRKIKRDAGRLIIPWTVLVLLLLPMMFWEEPEAMWNNIIYNRIGVVWFLLVLFGAKAIVYVTDALFTKPLPAKCAEFVGAAVGVLVGLKMELPFMLDIMFATVFWLLLGAELNCRKIRNQSYIEMRFSKLLFGLFLVVWGGGLVCQFFLSGHMFNYFTRAYPAWPLCYLVAIAGSGCVMELSKFIADNRAEKFVLLEWIGKRSMRLYFIHALDWYWMRWISLPMGVYWVVRIALDMAILFIFELCCNAKNKRKEMYK